MMDTVPLRDAIRALRVEVMEAIEAASTHPLKFELGSIELEFQVVARKEIGADAKIGFHIFAAEASVGGSGKTSDEHTQKVKLSLNPVVKADDGTSSKVEIARSSQSEGCDPSKSALDRT